MQVKTDFFVQIVHNSSFLHISNPFVQQIDAFLLEKGKRLLVRIQKRSPKSKESRGKVEGKSSQSRERVGEETVHSRANPRL